MVKVTIEQDGVRVSYVDTSENDPDFSACVRAFRGAAIGIGYADGTVSKFIEEQPWD